MNEPSDKFEQEADRVADAVMRGTLASGGFKENATKASSNSSGTRGNLDRDTREFMEARFGSNFDQVRVHTGLRASRASAALSARAFTTGRDIYFARGEYRPHTFSGLSLLAKEFTFFLNLPTCSGY